ncbi:porin [Limibaculum sp. M0105]|uniref:Porin n=1 Tax=Thermohalobaculum xanthum TaxID=2753746 RepID=A0A8J7M9C7_9RHOB|nr:porin [Thermohalobaculum xanthum]MBK0400538.1 porin [Thermohalobaculum xanthum]
MKKVLLSTSAIALAGAFASTASAAEWNVRVGGYMEQFVAYADSDVDGLAGEKLGGVDSKQDAEIHFIPTITLDNGIKFGANIQLEANTSGDQIDESYMFIQGSFGEIDLGSENSAGYKMTYAAPDVTFLNVNSGSTTAFIPWSGSVTNNIGTSVATGSDVFRGTLGATYIENDRNNDAQRITYYTPRFAGFQLGGSFARDAQQDSNAQVNLDNITGNYIDLGANYVNSFGEFDVAASARWGIGFNDAAGADDPTVLAFGLNLGYAGFTIGGSWAEQNNSSAGNADGTAWDAGISYETGPWGFSFTYFHGENQDNENVALGLGLDEEVSQYLLGVNYTLAKGVNLGAYGAYVDFEEDAGDGSAVGALTPGNDVDGFIIGTGVKISF